MKLVSESLFEFSKNNDPKSILGLGEDFYKKEIEKILLNFLNELISITPTFVWNENNLQLIFKSTTNNIKQHMLDIVVNKLLDDKLLYKSIKDLLVFINKKIYTYQTREQQYRPRYEDEPIIMDDAMIIFNFK